MKKWVMAAEVGGFAVAVVAVVVAVADCHDGQGRECGYCC